MILSDEIKEKCNNMVDEIFGGANKEEPDLETVNREVNLSVSLIEDGSGSMSNSNKLHNAKKSSINLVDNLKKESVEVGLISFGGKVKVETPLTTNFEKVNDKIRQLTAGGRTPFMKAMIAAQEEHFSRANGRKILVLDTDGKPSYESQSKILDYGEVLKENKVRIITIGIGKDVNENFLRKLASSPEDYYFAEAPEDIGETFREVTGTLVEQSH